MRIAVVAFSAHGAAVAKRIFALSSEGYEMSGYIARRHAQASGLEPFDSVYELASKLFYEADALVFIGACGIAVRAIAPLVSSKLNDPAVVVCDETGRFAISVLSGHAGGANNLTEQVANLIGATAVITTASDCHTAINSQEQPRNLVLGIGCRRGLSAERIERTATILLWDAKIPLARVCKAATIDVKQDERGLLKFAAAHSLPLSFYTAAQLKGVQGEFSSSDRVLAAVGVDNVCERAAVLCAGGGKIILKKTAMSGVTVAVAQQEGVDG